MSELGSAMDQLAQRLKNWVDDGGSNPPLSFTLHTQRACVRIMRNLKMNVSSMKKRLAFLERRLPYAIDITEYNQIKNKIAELRKMIVSTHMRIEI